MTLAPLPEGGLAAKRSMSHGVITDRLLPRGPESKNCALGLLLPFQAAASARRAKAGIDFEPVFFITAARWFSTVRRLMPRSTAMFLLG
jgi:hypothetical protein